MSILLILSGVEGLALLLSILMTKSAEGGILFGLSAARVAMAASVLIGAALLFSLGLTWHGRIKLVERIKKAAEKHTIRAGFILFWAFVLFLFLQAPVWYQIIFNPFKLLLAPQLHPQLRPLLIWISAVLIQLAIGTTLAHKNKLEATAPQKRIFLVWLLLGIDDLFSGRWVQKGTHKRRLPFWQNHKTSLLVFLGMLAVWIGIAITKIGLKPDTKFWNIAGIPILWHQIVYTAILALFLLDIARTEWGAGLEKSSQKSTFPILVFILIWAAAILTWQAEPLRHTYFSPGPYLPNQVKYPFSDALWFDTGGQYFLMGEGLYNGQLTDRPYLMLYHAFLHVLGGQDYDLIALFQIILLGLIPAGLYVIGWKLNSKIAGIATAALYIFREKNAIQGAFQIGLVNAKTLTSELPNALLLVFIAICLFNWFRQGKPSALWPVLAGGLTGLAIGVRGNSLTVIPLALLLALLVYLKEQNFTRQWVMAGVFFLLGAGVVLAPYSIENVQNHGSPFWLIKVQNVITRSEEQPISYAPSVRQQKIIQAENSLSPNPALGEFASLAAGHFLHNEIATVLMLPLSWQADPLDTAIQHPIWDTTVTWTGDLTAGETLALGIYLLMLAFGIGEATRRGGLAGLVPLAIHLTYNLTNGLAHTSGGRYLVATDWALIVYFVLGIIAVIQALRGWKAPSAPAALPVPRGRSAIVLPALSLLGFLILGSSFLFSGLIPNRYDLGNREAYWDYLAAEADQLAEQGIELDEISTFLDSENAVLDLGLALYPRAYQAGEETQRSSYLPKIPADNARLYFLMLEEDGQRHVSITLNPEGPISAFPHGAYGLILGCALEEYTQGKVFIPLDTPGAQILIEDDLVFKCD